MKKTILITVLLCSITLFGQESEKTSQSKDVIESFMQLSSQQLLDTANYYFKRNSYDTAVVCFNLLINAIPKSDEIEHKKLLQSAYDRLANIHFLVSDFRIAYDFLIKSLLICEKYNLKDAETRIYGNIGTIYINLNQFDLGKQYHLKALELAKDSIEIAILLNNLGDTEIKNNNPDSAYYYLNQALNISNQINNNRPKHSIYNTLAMYYQMKKQYDSAIYYFRSSLELSRINNSTEFEVANLSDLGKLYFQLNKIDSALYYINLSNKKAYNNKFVRILAENYKTLSEIEKSKGRYKNALGYYETYNNLKDSIYNAGVFGSINLFQRQYEVSKTNQQIEELEIDRQLKENTIQYQRNIQRIIFVTLFMMGIILLFVFLQNKKLKKAYNVLVEKNIEIIELYKNYAEDTEIEALEEAQKDISHTPEILSQIPVYENNNKKAKKEILSEQGQKELLSIILSFMENTSIICTSDFTVEKLTESIHSNQKYVSFVINNVLKKNFNSFLNGYRIREAQRLFSNSDTSKYTVEFVANMVGYKSRNSFSDAFKEITGVTPGFYIMAIHRKK